MFGIDKAIDEFNKERLYGKKPKLPKKITSKIKKEFGELIEIEPSSKVIVITINRILEYLEWLDK